MTGLRAAAVDWKFFNLLKSSEGRHAGVPVNHLNPLQRARASSAPITKNVAVKGFE